MGRSALKSAPGTGFTGALFSVTDVTGNEWMNEWMVPWSSDPAAAEAGEAQGIPWNYWSFGMCPAQCLAAPSLAISWQGTQLLHLCPLCHSSSWTIWAALTPHPSTIPPCWGGKTGEKLIFPQVKNWWGKTWRISVSPQHQQIHPRSSSTGPTLLQCPSPSLSAFPDGAGQPHSLHSPKAPSPPALTSS